MKASELIYDWNTIDAPPHVPRKVEFDDETLRDGLQSPSVKDPSIEKKIEILHLMEISRHRLRRCWSARCWTTCLSGCS